MSALGTVQVWLTMDTEYTFPLRKVPAFAFWQKSEGLASTFWQDCEGPYQCKVFLKYRSFQEASIYVVCPVHVQGSKVTQHFQLDYDAENWEDLSLNTCVPNENQRAKMWRKQSSERFIALSLRLHQACPIRCSPSLGDIEPEPGHESSFDQFGQLARALIVRLVFEQHFLGDKSGDITQLLGCSRSLTGVPAHTYSGPLTRKIDWTFFNPPNDNVPGAPPPFVHR